VYDGAVLYIRQEKKAVLYTSGKRELCCIREGYWRGAEGGRGRDGMREGASDRESVCE
jgi:hypothetical protein